MPDGRPQDPKSLLKGLENLYQRFNRRKFIHPDPLEFLFHFPDPRDREIVGLIAASLAYGRVWQILDSINKCLEKIGPHPRSFLEHTTEHALMKAFENFQYRFTKGAEMSRFMVGIKRALERHGSIEALFSIGASSTTGPEATIKRLKAATDELLCLSELPRSHLLPDPAKKSACKRPFLFLRWMVRQDQVDPGGWKTIKAPDLVIPLDTHMHHIAFALGFTTKKRPSLSAALEITKAFSRLAPEDPVRYDFVLTRFGIRDELSRDDVQRLLL